MSATFAAVEVGVWLIGLLVTVLLAAIAGGKAGTHFHRKIDRVDQ